MNNSSEEKNDSAFIHDKISKNIEEDTREALEKQADDTLKNAKEKYLITFTEENVLIRIFVRILSKAGDRNSIAVIVSIQMGKLQTRYKTRHLKYVRNQFNICKETFFLINKVPNNQNCLRWCDRLNSNLDGQGCKYCNYIGGFNSSLYKCKKSKTICDFKYDKISFLKNK